MGSTQSTWGLISRVSSRTYRNTERRSSASFKMAEKVQRLRVSMIRDQNKKELLEKVATLRQELATLRVAKVTGQSTSKVGKINTVRKDIARVLTVINQAQKAELQKFYRGNKTRPTDLKPRKTRARRKGLNKHELSLKKIKAVKRACKNNQLKYAIKPKCISVFLFDFEFLEKCLAWLQ